MNLWQSVKVKDWKLKCEGKLLDIIGELSGTSGTLAPSCLLVTRLAEPGCNRLGEPIYLVSSFVTSGIRNPCKTHTRNWIIKPAAFVFPRAR